MSFEALLGKLSERPDRRGREFERICKWFLENAPEYRGQIRRVWLWREWPGRWGADIGIDLVVETCDRDLWAVQAKAYDARYSVTKRDVDSFLSESNRPVFAFRLLLATTDRIARNARSALKGQEKPVGLRLLSDLAGADVAWPGTPAKLLPARPKPKRLRPDQRLALRDVVDGFNGSARGKLLMACGTGKTIVGLHVAEALSTRRTLVLVPSLALVEQTLREWTANRLRPFSYLAVCSDVSVVEHDSVVASTVELGVPVTTDPARVAAFLRTRHDHAVSKPEVDESKPVVAKSFASRTGKTLGPSAWVAGCPWAEPSSYAPVLRHRHGSSVRPGLVRSLTDYFVPNRVPNCRNRACLSAPKST